MVNEKWDIVILGGVRDFHAMDWYRAVRRNSRGRKVNFVSDLVEAEGLKSLAAPEDEITLLFVIDRFLFSNNSTLGHLWRNVVKALVFPFQLAKLRHLYWQHEFTIAHAHPMYYMLLCYFSRVPYVGTPQGDELLIRPNKSVAYRYFAALALRGAQAIVVDSMQMKQAAEKISGVDAYLIQNGINVEAIIAAGKGCKQRSRVTSIRGLDSLYRIKDIIIHRNAHCAEIALTLLYPFYDSAYSSLVKGVLQEHDEDLGRLDKTQMYQVFYESLLVISIPTSDSSPRSVYEAIFSGCCVAVTYNPWIDFLPECMKARVYIIDLDDPDWLNGAISFSKKHMLHVFEPSAMALELFDEDVSIRKVVDMLY